MEGNSVANTTNSSSSLSTTTSSSPTLSTPATEITPQAANLQLHDLLCPTEKAQSLLETLTPEQITLIEQTLQRIREKKSQMMTPVLSPPTTPPSDLPSPPAQEDWSWAATQVAKALADAMTDANSKPAESSSATAPPPAKPASNEPVTEVRDGVEWVSFVYSHHRILKRYCIRTDLDKVDINQLDDKFKRDNCVYPRANLPRETYRGNRWAYETECNMLGWKLAWLNASEIAGKRGLIQRAVDSYRNRYPSMRSRRVARQEKLLNGTLRKRKHRDGIFDDTCSTNSDLEALSSKVPKPNTCQQDSSSKYVPKTISIDDGPQGTKCRIRINIESVPLEAIDMPFRQSNCVFPRAMNITPSTPSVTQRQLDEAACNELGWKLAWLNPRQLANRKSLLQRVLDIYRTKFAPHLKPRKYAMRTPPAPFAPPPQSATDTTSKPTKLTAEALAAQQQQFSNVLCVKVPGAKDNTDDDQESTYSGTTASLDFRDCFSPPAETAEAPMLLDSSSSSNIQQQQPPPSALLAPTATTSTTTDYSLDNFMLKGDLMLCDQVFQDDMSCCQLSVETNSSNPSNQSSPRQAPVIDNTDFDSAFLIGDSVMDMNLFGENEDVLKRYLCAPADQCELSDEPVNIKMESFVDVDPASMSLKVDSLQDIDSSSSGSMYLF